MTRIIFAAAFALTQVFGGSHSHFFAMAASLRALLEENQSRIFKNDGVADYLIDTVDIDARLAAIHRALVAHQALNKALREIGGEDAQRDKLLDAIQECLQLECITSHEARWLKHFNNAANEAKHSLGAIS